MAVRPDDEHPGYMTRRPQILINHIPIPQICDAGSTFLGMTIAPGAQQSRALFMKLRPLINSWLRNIDKSAHDLPSRLWIYQHAIISRLRFSLTIHPCITMNFVLRLQKLCTNFLRRWINVARGSSPEAIYSSRGWGLRSLSQLWHECTADLMCQLKKSKDPAAAAVLRNKIREEEERRLKGQIRPATHITHCLNDRSRARKTLIDLNEERMINALRRRTTVAIQWWDTNTEEDQAKDFAAAINGLRSTSLSRFATHVMVQAPLPTRTMLRTWGKNGANSMSCRICNSAPETLRHLLSGCRTSLDQGRYTYRHDRVLSVLANAIVGSPNTSWASFDLEGLRNLPSWWAALETTLRPDGLVRLHDGTEFIVELTVPWEDNIAEAHCRKTEKYQNILHRRRMDHPNTHLLCMEVGVRGLPASSLRQVARLFGSDKGLSTECQLEAIREAIRSSFVIWLNRESPDWKGGG